MDPKITFTFTAETIARLAAEALVSTSFEDAVAITCSDASVKQSLIRNARAGLAARYTLADENSICYPASSQEVAEKLVKLGVPSDLADNVTGQLISAYHLRRAEDLIGDQAAADALCARIGSPSSGVTGDITVAVASAPVIEPVVTDHEPPVQPESPVVTDEELVA